MGVDQKDYTLCRRQSKVNTIDKQLYQKSLETEFSIAICHQIAICRQLATNGNQKHYF